MLNFLKKNIITPVKYKKRKAAAGNTKPGFASLFDSGASADVYFGGQYSPSDLRRFERMGITAIINMRSAIQPEDLQTGFEYLRLPLPDNAPPDTDTLVKGAEFIDTQVKNGGKVYINCLRGRGRGPLLVIAWLILCGETYDDAFRIVRSSRRDIELNYLQIERLKELQNTIKEAVRY